MLADAVVIVMRVAGCQPAIRGFGTVILERWKFSWSGAHGRRDREQSAMCKGFNLLD
jgi:hypothetical protein